MTYALGTGAQRHIAAPRTAPNTGNGTQAALNIQWVGWLAEHRRMPPTSLAGSHVAGRREGCAPKLARGSLVLLTRLARKVHSDA
jgi:hypothetical protein